MHEPIAILDIPSTTTILAALKERLDTAQCRRDYAHAARLARTRLNVQQGAWFRWTDDGLEVASASQAGQVYTVTARGCNCPNGQAGRAECWHVVLRDALVEMQEDAAAARDILADAAAERAAVADERERALGLARRVAVERTRAQQEIEELFNY